MSPKKINEAKEAVEKIVKDLYAGLVSENFFEGKKTQLRSLNEDNLDNLRSRAESWVTREFEKPAYDFRKIPEELEGITREELLDIAKRNLSGEPLIVIASAPGYR